MNNITKKDKFSNDLSLTLLLYGHFQDKYTLKKAVDTTLNEENELSQNFKEINSLKSLLYNLNKNIDVNDIILKLCEIESYSNIMDTSLTGIENFREPNFNIEDYARNLKVVNTQNIKLLRELFTMLDSKEFKISQ